MTNYGGCTNFCCHHYLWKTVPQSILSVGKRRPEILILQVVIFVKRPVECTEGSGQELREQFTITFRSTLSEKAVEITSHIPTALHNMSNNDIPKGFDSIYDPDKRRFVYQSRRSGHRQVNRPGPDTFYQEYNPEHNRFRVYNRPQSPSRYSNRSMTSHSFYSSPEHTHWPSSSMTSENGRQASFHTEFFGGLPAQSSPPRRTVWDDHEENPVWIGTDWSSPNLSQHVPNNSDHYSVNSASQSSNQARSFSCATTLAREEDRFEPAWHQLSDLVRARAMARNAPFRNEESSRLVFELPVQLLFIGTEYGSIIKINRPSTNYMQSTRMKSFPILKVIRNPDRYQTDVLFNVSTAEHIVYELRQYTGRRSPNKRVKCYIREPARSGRNIVVLERKWDLLRTHPVTVTLTTDNYTDDRQHSAATEPRYLEIHKSKSERTRSGGYEAVEYLDRRTAAIVTSTAAPAIRQISVSPRVNIALLVLIIAAADMMWQ